MVPLPSDTCLRETLEWALLVAVLWNSLPLPAILPDAGIYRLLIQADFWKENLKMIF